MAIQLDTTVANEILNSLFKGSAFTAKTAYIALFDGVTEVTNTLTGTNRPQIWGADTVASGALVNAADFTIIASAVAAADVDGVQIYDAATGGNAITIKKTVTAQSYNIGDEVKINANNLEFTFNV